MSNAQLSPRCLTASPLLALLYGLSPIHRSALPIFFGYFIFPPSPHHLFIGFKNLSRFVCFFFFTLTANHWFAPYLIHP